MNKYGSAVLSFKYNTFLMTFIIQFNTYLQINLIKTKKMFFDFELAQLANIWKDCRQLQSRQHVQIFEEAYFLWHT